MAAHALSFFGQAVDEISTVEKAREGVGVCETFEVALHLAQRVLRVAAGRNVPSHENDLVGPKAVVVTTPFAPALPAMKLASPRKRAAKAVSGRS